LQQTAQRAARTTYLTSNNSPQNSTGNGRKTD